jgi:cephalosporin hydroxylase
MFLGRRKRQGSRLTRIHVDDIGRANVVARASNPLETLYYGHEGHAAYKWHHYLALYDRHLSRFRGRPVRILELGIYHGGSLQIWKKYFGERAVIHGVDINPACTRFAEERVVPHIGNQADAGLLKQVVEQMGGVDVVIDDASHRGPDQIASFEALYPLLDENGVYVCEDTRTSYWSQFGGGYRRPGTFIEYAKDLIDRLHPWYIEDEAIARDETFARMTLGIFFYDSMIVFEKRAKPIPFQCAVGRKRGLLGTLYWHLLAALHKRKR